MKPGFFSVGQRRGHWFFLDPEGNPFFSLGMNHIDSATLRYRENGRIWREKYGNDQHRWLKESVGPDLRRWGFNTVGWVQEVVIRGRTIHRHSRNFTRDEYQSLGLPYCHMLPFAEIHQWDVETSYPDVFGNDFEDWCDCVAREHCATFADDPDLIGYFYSDCPQWVHATKPELKGPWFDPEKLKSTSGRRELTSMAGQYYRVTREAVRRYDPHHLILGDRYEAMAPLPKEVLAAALPHVDVLSFQFFADIDATASAFTSWHDWTGKPVLLADACVPNREEGFEKAKDIYPDMLGRLRELPSCVGWHYCGAYLRNRVRQAGFRDELESIVNPAFLKTVSDANQETQRWVADYADHDPPASFSCRQKES